MAQSALPADLRIFAHAQFDAEEYVRGVCRESSTGLQIRERLERLRALRVVANEGLLRGAQEQAGTYVAATNKIRATAHELNAIVRQLYEFEEGLADLDDALARSLGEETSPRPQFPTHDDTEVANPSVLNGTPLQNTSGWARLAKPENGEVAKSPLRRTLETSNRKLEGDRVSDVQTPETATRKVEGNITSDTQEKREKEPLSERREKARTRVRNEKLARQESKETPPRTPEDAGRKREEESTSKRREKTRVREEEELGLSMVSEAPRRKQEETSRNREIEPATRERRVELKSSTREDERNRTKREEQNRKQKPNGPRQDTPIRTRREDAATTDTPDVRKRSSRRKSSGSDTGSRRTGVDSVKVNNHERSSRVGNDRDLAQSRRASDTREKPVENGGIGDAELSRSSMLEKRMRSAVVAKKGGVGATRSTTSNRRRETPTTPPVREVELDDDDDDDVQMDDAESVKDTVLTPPVVDADKKSRVTRTGRSANPSKSATIDDFASIDRLLDEGRIGLAVSRWLRSSRDFRKTKKSLDPEAGEKLSRSIESRREPLAKAAEKGRVDGDARRLFGFGKGLKDASREDTREESQSTIADAKLLFSDFDEERELRARHAMLHALGRKDLLEARLARLRSGLDSLQASEPGRFWDGLAFAVNDAYELFRSSEERKNGKVESAIVSFGNDAVASLVQTLAADLFTEERKHKALSDSARLARLVKAGSKSFDAFATDRAWPEAFRSRPFQLNALAPALASHCKTLKPSAVKAALGGDKQLADAVLVEHAKVADVDH